MVFTAVWIESFYFFYCENNENFRLGYLSSTHVVLASIYPHPIPSLANFKLMHNFKQIINYEAVSAWWIVGSDIVVDYDHPAVLSLISPFHNVLFEMQNGQRTWTPCNFQWHVHDCCRTTLPKIYLLLLHSLQSCNKVVKEFLERSATSPEPIQNSVHHVLFWALTHLLLFDIISFFTLQSTITFCLMLGRKSFSFAICYFCSLVFIRAPSGRGSFHVNKLVEPKFKNPGNVMTDLDVKERAMNLKFILC